MLHHFNKAFEDYRRILLNTFWFVPGMISLSGPLLAFLFLKLDHSLQPSQELFVFRGGTAEASTLLSTIAGSLITVAGLAFSITIVVLQLVSSQYTPRALRGFLQDRVAQVIAGGFFAISAYSLIVLAAMSEPSPTDRGFLPALSVTVAIGLGLLGLALLLIFVHHTGRVIQVSDIAARIAAQTLQTIDHPYPNWDGEELANDPTTGVLCIKYLQAVFERLVHRLPEPSTYRFAGWTSSLEIRQPTFEEYLEVFAEIGHYAGGNVRVINTLLTALACVTEIATFHEMQERQDLLAAMTATLAALSRLRTGVSAQ